jgi:hypothetical protein
MARVERCSKIAGGRANKLTNAVMVEPDRNAAGRNEYGHPVTNNQRSRPIDLKPVAAIQLYRKDPERFLLLQASQYSIKVLGGHRDPLTQYCFDQKLA